MAISRIRLSNPLTAFAASIFIHVAALFLFFFVVTHEEQVMDQDAWSGSIDIEMTRTRVTDVTHHSRAIVRSKSLKLPAPSTSISTSGAIPTSVVPAPAPATISESGGESEALNPSEASEMEVYVREIRRELNRLKTYPLAARRLGHRGRVVVRFLLDRSGQVIEAEIIHESSSQFLNQAARDLVGGLDGVKPFPAGIAKPRWAFQVPIDYQM